MSDWGTPAALDATDRADIDAFLEGHLDELIAFRRRVHAHPELSSQEFATTEAVASRLQVSGLVPQVFESGTGLICDIVVGNESDANDGPIPTIALRADLDALAMEDESTTPYRSTVPGVAHACGHDAHTTIVVGAGLLLQRLLAREGSPCGRVRLIFEPAEEALPGGAVGIIEDGYLKEVGAIYGLHCDPKIDVGTLGLNPGPITSAADLVEIARKNTELRDEAQQLVREQWNEKMSTLPANLQPKMTEYVESALSNSSLANRAESIAAKLSEFGLQSEGDDGRIWQKCLGWHLWYLSLVPNGYKRIVAWGCLNNLSRLWVRRFRRA